jgi:hypothetical protein
MEEERERWERVKKLAPGLWKSGRTILEGLVSVGIRSQIGI